jgi:hypothetical protein
VLLTCPGNATSCFWLLLEFIRCCVSSGTELAYWPCFMSAYLNNEKMQIHWDADGPQLDPCLDSNSWPWQQHTKGTNEPSSHSVSCSPLPNSP